jgi:hypothetical protein
MPVTLERGGGFTGQGHGQSQPGGRIKGQQVIDQGVVTVRLTVPAGRLVDGGQVIQPPESRGRVIF